MLFEQCRATVCHSCIIAFEFIEARLLKREFLHKAGHICSKHLRQTFLSPLVYSQKTTRIYSWLHSSNELKLILTNVAVEKLPSFMKWCYVNILKGCFLAKVTWHALHWKRFLFSWTDAMCQFKCFLFFAKLTSQMMLWKGFFSSTTDATHLFKPSFSATLALQMLHLNDFFPSWTDAKWLFKLSFCVKLLLQS